MMLLRGARWLALEVARDAVLITACYAVAAAALAFIFWVVVTLTPPVTP